MLLNRICTLALQATSVGQAVAGFAVSVLSFLTTWAALVPEPGEERGPRDVAMTAFAYFGLSAAVVVASMAGYWMLQLIPFWLHYTSSHSGHGKPSSISPQLPIQAIDIYTCIYAALYKLLQK